MSLAVHASTEHPVCTCRRKHRVTKPLAFLGAQSALAPTLLIPAAIFGVVRAATAAIVGLGATLVRLDWTLHVLPLPLDPGYESYLAQVLLVEKLGEVGDRTSWWAKLRAALQDPRTKAGLLRRVARTRLNLVKASCT